MRWTKQGRVYVPDGSMAWAQHYAFPPTPIQLDDDTLRLYLAFCDADTIGRLAWVDVALDDPTEVVGVSPAPALDIGEPGCFDDNGLLPTRVLAVDDRLLAYYVGYQRGTRVPYFQFQGLAYSTDGGASFSRWSRVPILDRSDAEPLHRTSAFVDRDGDRFRMWYVAGDEWVPVGERSLPRYNLRYLESPDGVTWGDRGQVCLDFADDDEHAFGRPWVFRHDGRHKLIYSVRRRSNGYRLGYAESADGIAWERHDDAVGIDVSAEGWDSEEIAYGSVVLRDDGSAYLFYNGNARGRTGFGVAVLESWD
jgi:sucrose-6-phosphate hydrolase SacC (GH32 family)